MYNLLNKIMSGKSRGILSLRPPSRSPPPPLPGDGGGAAAGPPGRHRVDWRQNVNDSDDDERGPSNSREYDAIIEDARKVLLAWDQMSPTTYSTLTQTSKKTLEDLLKRHLPLKLAEIITDKYNHLPETVRQLYVEKCVGAIIGHALYYARIMFAQYFGLNDGGEIDINIDDNSDATLLEYDLVLTAVTDLTLNTRSFQESLSRITDVVVRHPVKTAVNIALVPFAAKVASELAPLFSKLLETAAVESPPLGEIATVISEYAFDNKLSAFYAAVYFVYANYDTIIETVAGEKPTDDIPGLIHALSKRFERESHEQITGVRPEQISDFWGVASWLGWRIKSTCVSQVNLAAGGVRSLFNLAANVPTYCKKFISSAQATMSEAALSLEVKGSQGDVTDVTYGVFHDKIRELLETPKFLSLAGNASVNKHKDNLSRGDPRKFIPFETRLEHHVARHLLSSKLSELSAYRPPSPGGSLEAHRFTQPDDESLNDELYSVMRKQEQDLLGPVVMEGGNGEVIGLKYMDQGNSDQGNSDDFMGGRSRSRKRSASKRTRRKGISKKQKSKKNKRQSRRKLRHSSSRKGRK
jgi:hypothetical protein